MIRRVPFDPEATEEFFEAMRWYESARPGLGWEFLGEVHRAVTLIEKHPDIGSPVRGSIRRVLLRRFPYWLYYRVEGDVLRVLACYGARRDQSDLDTRIH